MLPTPLMCRAGATVVLDIVLFLNNIIILIIILMNSLEVRLEVVVKMNSNYIITILNTYGGLS